MKYSDQQRIEKIRETTEKLLNYVQREQITPEKICNEETVQWTVTTPLYNIGEHVYNLSDEFKKAHPEIPWIKIAGLRHRLVHHYEDTNWIVRRSETSDPHRDPHAETSGRNQRTKECWIARRFGQKRAQKARKAANLTLPISW